MNPGPFLMYLTIVGGCIWFAADMLFLLRSAQRRHQLTLEGRWADLERHFEGVEKTRRPFAWFWQRYLLPGGNATQFGLFLFQQGRLEQALTEVDRAISQVGKKPVLLRPFLRGATKAIRCGSRAARMLILTGMGRYDEVRAEAVRLGQASGSSVDANSPLALMETNCGRLDEALALARNVPPAHHQYDAMRSTTAWIYSLKGEPARAVEVMTHEPAGVAKFYRSEDLKTMGASPDGAKLIELQGRNLAGIFPPARWIRVAQTYLDQEAFANADAALGEAEKSLGSNQVLQISYWRTRARSHAGQGKSAEADDCIGRARALIQQFPRRSTVMETHLAIGRSYLSLRRFSKALMELGEARRNSLHPIERHQANYWTARTHEAAGNSLEALTYYKLVAADPIPSWMHRQAASICGKPFA